MDRMAKVFQQESGRKESFEKLAIDNQGLYLARIGAIDSIANGVSNAVAKWDIKFQNPLYKLKKTCRDPQGKIIKNAKAKDGKKGGWNE